SREGPWRRQFRATRPSRLILAPVTGEVRRLRLGAHPEHAAVLEARKRRCQPLRRNPCDTLARMPAFKTGLLVVIGALSAYSQNSSGTLSGLIKDTSNAAVPKAHVTVLNENTGLRRAVETNDDGTFRVPFLPVGIYSVQVQKDRFRSEIQKSVQLEILQVRTVDFTLQVGAVSEAITVQTDSPLLDAESSQSGEVIKTEQVTNLPLGRRNFMQLAFLAPMATPATRDFRTTEIGRGSSVP